MSNHKIQSYGELSSLYYDAIEHYASEHEVDFFSSFIKQNPGRILEAMSGSGRLQIPLMQQGYIVDGVDISDAMLARCRQRCIQLEFKPELYEQSLEHLAIPHRYSTIIIAFGSLQLIADRDLVVKALKNLNNHMLPGSNLFIDIFVPDINMDTHAVSTVRLDKHTIIRLTKRHVFHVDEKRVDSFCLYELLVDGIVQQQEDELIEIAWRSDAEWHELLLETGFEIVHIYDEIFRKSEQSRVIHARAISK